MHFKLRSPCGRVVMFQVYLSGQIFRLLQAGLLLMVLVVLLPEFGFVLIFCKFLQNGRYMNIIRLCYLEKRTISRLQMAFFQQK